MTICSYFKVQQKLKSYVNRILLKTNLFKKITGAKTMGKKICTLRQNKKRLSHIMQNVSNSQSSIKQFTKRPDYVSRAKEKARGQS